MTKFKAEIEIAYSKILTLDAEDYPDEQSVKNYISVNFPEWLSDDNCDDVLYSLGYTIISIDKTGE